MSVERFKISARLMKHLGEALISDELVALMELIKNSFDADANFSKVSVDSKRFDGKGLIVVDDDGCGMDYDIITNSFLVLATDFKLKTQKKSPKYNRLALGNKGIGRLSLQRLGDRCSVVTKMENKNAYSFSINWEDFFDANKEIYDIEIDVKETPELNGIFKKGHGTRIEIENIKNIALWESKQTFSRFKNEVLSIINPFSSDEERFSITIDLNGEKMISDKYDVELIRNYSDVFSTFEYLSNENRLIIDTTRQKKYIDWILRRFNSAIYTNEFDIEINNDKLYELFGHSIIDFNLDEVHKLFPFVSDRDYRFNNLFLPGDFKGEIFAFDKSAGRFTKETKTFLELINGVKLFRNGFRILPYGDPQNDWLYFTKYSQTLKYNIYRNHTTSGYVYIDGEENLQKIQEMTNRQGIILDEFGESFLTICRAVISRILVQQDIELTTQIVPSVSDVFSIKYGDSRAFCDGAIIFKRKENRIASIYKAAETIKKAIEKSGIKTNTSSYKTVKSSLADINCELKGADSQLESEKQLIKEQQKSIDDFKITIGSALVSEFMSHEIMRTVNNSLECVNRIKEAVSSGEGDKLVVCRLLDAIATHLNYLARYASVIDLNSYTKRRKKENVDLKSFILEIKQSVPFLSKDGGDINCVVEGDNCECEIIKSNFTIALENILINSKYWLDRYDIKDKKITIHIDAEKKNIVIFDNGLGIHRDIEKSIFEAFVSAKPDGEGRGIGLYITDKLLSEIRMRISLSDERNSSGNLYKFIIEF